MSGSTEVEDAANVGGVAGNAGDDVIFDDERRHRGEVAELGVGEFDVPHELSIFGGEAKQVRVGRREIKFVAEHGDAAMADVIAGDFAFEMPDRQAEARVDGVDVVGDGEIQDAVHFERSGFDALAVRAINPGERELIYVVGIDLIERRKAFAGVIAIVGGPGVGGLFLQQSLWVEALGVERWGVHGDEKQQHAHGTCEGSEAACKAGLVLAALSWIVHVVIPEHAHLAPVSSVCT